MPLEPEDAQHLRAAEGYLALGMHADSNAELEKIDPAIAQASEVLTVRMEVCYATQNWGALQVIARKLAQAAPNNVQWTISWAYAARRAESIDVARDILLMAVERLPQVAHFHYNLACYECQLGHVEVAKARLAHAFKLDESFRLLALNDEDLRPLWDYLRK